jgi:Putative papain-like cysteine peptidase (DUF1796)
MYVEDLRRGLNAGTLRKGFFELTSDVLCGNRTCAWGNFMKIRLITYKDITLSLVIEKGYVTRNPIISLGCDCHPAHVLNTLNLRKFSSPFDWLYTTPSKGLNYVNKNIKEGFKFFLSDLVKNEKGCVFSSNYAGSRFSHYPDLIDNQKTRKMFSRRWRRFLYYFNNRNCLFLFNITSEGLKDTSDVSLFLDSVNEFHRLAKGNHLLLIYIRYDECFQENEMNCGSVEKELRKLKQTRIARYIRHKNDYGTWGDESRFSELMESLGVKLKLGFPIVSLLKTSDDKNT